ncbi:MAG: VWA domain-containing protein [Candidatus Zixiibacteriota bacterium]
MRFYEPLYLLGILLIPILGLFYWIAIERKKKILARFGEIPLIMRAASGISYTRQAGKAAMLLSAILFLSLAAAKPQLGTHMEMVKREGLDVMIAIDVSRSMEALDVIPGPISRLEKAKQEIRGLLTPERLQGDRIGLVAFAGEAFIQCPLTIDYRAARIFLDIITTEIVNVPGTAIGSAIQKAATGFESKERKHKVLILLTDGEDHNTDPITAATEARKQGIKIYTIGIGNPDGEPIPIYNKQGERVSFKKDEEGEIIISKMDEATLQKIALETGGRYFHATPSELELDKIFDEISGMEKKELEGKLLLQYDDRFQWPLVFALLFIIWEVFVPERIKKKKEEFA